jgi:hypothetical protein
LRPRIRRRGKPLDGTVFNIAPLEHYCHERIYASPKVFKYIYPPPFRKFRSLGKWKIYKSLHPRRVVTGEYLAKSRLDARGRAKLAADLIEGRAVLGKLTAKQITTLCRSNAVYVTDARKPPVVTTLAETLAAALRESSRANSAPASCGKSSNTPRLEVLKSTASSERAAPTSVSHRSLAMNTERTLSADAKIQRAARNFVEYLGRDEFKDYLGYLEDESGFYDKELLRNHIWVSVKTVADWLKLKIEPADLD